MSAPRPPAPSDSALRGLLGRARAALRDDLKRLERLEAQAADAIVAVEAEARRQLAPLAERMDQLGTLARSNPGRARALEVDLAPLHAEWREEVARWTALRDVHRDALAAVHSERATCERTLATLDEAEAELARERSIDALLRAPTPKRTGAHERRRMAALADLAKELDGMRRPDHAAKPEAALSGVQRSLDALRLARGAPLGDAIELPTPPERAPFEQAEHLIDAQDQAFASVPSRPPPWPRRAPTASRSAHGRVLGLSIALGAVLALTGWLIATFVDELTGPADPAGPARAPVAVAALTMTTPEPAPAEPARLTPPSPEPTPPDAPPPPAGSTSSLSSLSSSNPTTTREPPSTTHRSSHRNLRARVERDPRDAQAGLGLARTLEASDNPLGAWRHLSYLETLEHLGDPKARRALERARRDPDLVPLLDTLHPAP